jgi:hypothetical protein
LTLRVALSRFGWRVLGTVVGVRQRGLDASEGEAGGGQFAGQEIRAVPK